MSASPAPLPLPLSASCSCSSHTSSPRSCSSSCGVVVPRACTGCGDAEAPSPEPELARWWPSSSFSSSSMIPMMRAPPRTTTLHSSLFIMDSAATAATATASDHAAREAEALAYLLGALADPAPSPAPWGDDPVALHPTGTTGTTSLLLASLSAASAEQPLSARVGAAPPKLELGGPPGEGPPQLSPVDSEDGTDLGGDDDGLGGSFLRSRRESSLFGPGLLEALLGGNNGVLLPLPPPPASGAAAPAHHAPAPRRRTHASPSHHTATSTMTATTARIIRTCKECNKEYTTREGLRLHMRNMHLDDKQHVCELCDMRFVRGGDLKLHLIRVHEPASARPCRCPFPGCGKAFACKSELTRHSKIHNRPADRSFMSTSSLYGSLRGGGEEEDAPIEANASEGRMPAVTAMMVDDHDDDDDDEDYHEGDDDDHLGGGGGSKKRVRSMQ